MKIEGSFILKTLYHYSNVTQIIGLTFVRQNVSLCVDGLIGPFISAFFLFINVILVSSTSVINKTKGHTLFPVIRLVSYR